MNKKKVKGIESGFLKRVFTIQSYQWLIGGGEALQNPTPAFQLRANLPRILDEFSKAQKTN